MIDFQLEDVFILLTPAMILSAIVCGFIFGHIYYRRIPTSNNVIYTVYIQGITFLILLGLVRSTESGIWERWLGVGILWTIFSVVAFLGKRIQGR